MTLPRQDRLGYFVGFMQAWGRTDADTHATVYLEALEYEAGIFTAPEYVTLVSDQLGIPAPVVV